MKKILCCSLLALCSFFDGTGTYAATAKQIKPTVITVSLGAELDTMDPHTSSSALATTVHRYVFDTLMHRPSGTNTLVPWAAREVVQVGPRVLEFRMREGVKFTNGEDVDAHAVQFSLMRPLNQVVCRINALLGHRVRVERL